MTDQNTITTTTTTANPNNRLHLHPPPKTSNGPVGCGLPPPPMRATSHYGNHHLPSTATTTVGNNNCNDDPIKKAVSAAAALAQVQAVAAAAPPPPAPPPATAVAAATRYTPPHSLPHHQIPTIPLPVPPPRSVVPVVPIAAHWQGPAAAPLPGIAFHPLPHAGHHVGVPPMILTTTTVAAMSGPPEPHPIFRNRKLRSGKWTPQEEAYAECLIELFEKGHIDEKNGCTLRSFLSRKLHCPPMRISKKYAGKGIGKMVFLSKMTISTIDGYGSAAYNENMKKLREAESNFFKTVYPELTLPFHPAGHFMFPPPQSSAGLAPIAPAPVSMSHPHASTMAPPIHHATTQTGMAPVMYPPTWQQQGVQHVPSQARQPPTNPMAITRPPVHKQNSAAAKNQSACSSALQQVYLSAANSVMQCCNGGFTEQTPLAPPSCDKAAAVASQEAKNLQKICGNQVPTETTEEKKVIDSKAKLEAMSSLSDNTGNRKTKTAMVASALVATSDGSKSRLSTAPVSASLSKSHTSAVTLTTPRPRLFDEAQYQASAAHKSASAPNLSEMPDFLSAFDKINAGQQHQQQSSAATGRSSVSGHHENTTGNQFSPPFTSKSFDDLHRFLGKDLSPVSAPRSLSVEVPISRGMPVIPMPSPYKAPEQLPAPAAPKLTPKPSAEQYFENLKQIGRNYASREGEQFKPSYSSMLSDAYTEAIEKMKKPEAKIDAKGPDAYYVYAQQSVLAAGQHAAYTMAEDDSMPRKDVPTLELPPSVKDGRVNATSNNVEGQESSSAPGLSREQLSQTSRIIALKAMYQDGVFRNAPSSAGAQQGNLDLNDGITTNPYHSSLPATMLPTTNMVREPSNVSRNASSVESDGSRTTNTIEGGQTTSSDTTINDSSSSSNDSDGNNSDGPSYYPNDKRSRISFNLEVNKKPRRESSREQTPRAHII